MVVKKVKQSFLAREVSARFRVAATHRQYRSALRLARQLDKHGQLQVLSELFRAAARLHIDAVTGVPRVMPRGFVSVRGRAVAVEVLV